jgi:tetratricopeptide (TPR) repeat protein
MTTNADRIAELFAEIDTTSWGVRERALVDEAVQLAVETGDEQLEYQARMRLTASAKHLGDTDAMLASFAWCLAKHDEDPSRFPTDLDNGAADLLWQYKWMAGTLASSPIFARSDIEAVLDDMHEHYERAGIGLSGVYTARFEEAWSSGRMEEAERYRSQVAITPRDDHSHCDACSRGQFSGFLAETGREQEALTLVDEIIEGRFSCGDEPESALGRALLPFLRSGRIDDAKAAHLRSYRLSRDNPDKISIVSQHLVFCAVTGNEARGLAMLERHIDWLAHDPLNVAAHFTTLTAYGVLLDAIDRAGHGDTPVRGANAPALQKFFPQRDGAWTVRELAAASWSAAESIAAAFDERNGNDHHAVLVLRARALADEHYDVPIATDSFVPIPITREDPKDADGWRERAREFAALGEAADANAATLRSLQYDDDRERHVSYSLLIGGLVQQQDWTEAERLMPERIAALRAAGHEQQAALEERVGLAVFGRVDEATSDALEAELERLPHLDVPAEVLGDVQLSLAAIYLRTGREADARELLVRAVESFETADTAWGLTAALAFRAQYEANGDDPGVALALLERLLDRETNRAARGQALVLRARLHGASENPLPGSRDADEAAGLFAAIDARAETVNALALAGALFADADLPDEAISRYRHAVSQAELLDEDISALRFSFGRALVRGGLALEAVEILQQVYEAELAKEEPAASRGETLYWLGHALSESEQYGNAVGAWKAGIDLYLEGEDSRGAAKTGFALGTLLGRFEEHADAVEALSDAERLAHQTPDDLRLLTDVLHALGTAKARAGDESALATLDELIAIAEQNGADWLAADVTDSRARALLALGRAEEAIPVALGAADRYAAAGDESSAGGSELLVARILTEAGRAEDAVPIFRSAIERGADAPGLRAVAGMELGDALESLGRATEAQEARLAAEAAQNS